MTDFGGASGLFNRPRILRGAFVEHGLTVPPLTVVFQFNPEQLTRNRSLSFRVANEGASATELDPTGKTKTKPPDIPLRNFHKKHQDLLALRDLQIVDIQEETIGLDIRLDATDALNEGNPLAVQYGVAPQLSTLELMAYPKDESIIGEALLGKFQGFSFCKGQNPPLILFIWGRNRVLPVNINSLNITETEFSADLNPIRATVSVNLTVIEGQNPPFRYSKTMKETMSAINLAGIKATDVIIPG